MIEETYTIKINCDCVNCDHRFEIEDKICINECESRTFLMSKIFSNSWRIYKGRQYCSQCALLIEQRLSKNNPTYISKPIESVEFQI